MGTQVDMCSFRSESGEHKVNVETARRVLIQDLYSL
jgi:hypothetical protein